MQKGNKGMEGGEGRGHNVIGHVVIGHVGGGVGTRGPNSAEALSGTETDGVSLAA